MPVFDTAAAVRASRLPTYLETKHQRAITAGTKAQTDLINKQVENYDDEVAIEEQKAATSAGTLELKVREFWQKSDDRQREAASTASTAAIMAEDEGGDPVAAYNTVLGAFGYQGGDFQYNRDEHEAMVFAGAEFDAPKEYLMLNRPETPTEITKLQERLADPNTRPEDIPAIKARIAKLTAITGTTEFDPSNDPRTDSQRGSDFSKSNAKYNTSGEIREMIVDFLPRAKALPDAVGGMARFGQVLSSAADLVGGNATAEAIAEQLTGTDQATLQDMRVTMQLIRSKIRPIATGEEGARQSESERKIASEVISLTEKLENPLDLLKNYQQVLGALRRLNVESLVSQYHEANKWDDIQYPYDLTTDDGVVGLFIEFERAGLDVNGTDFDFVNSTVDRLLRIQTGQ